MMDQVKNQITIQPLLSTRIRPRLMVITEVFETARAKSLAVAKAAEELRKEGLAFLQKGQKQPFSAKLSGKMAQNLVFAVPPGLLPTRGEVEAR